MKDLQKKVLFLAIFILIGFISLQIPFNKLAGSNVSFTLFDFFGPIAGAFLGPFFGIVSVLTVEIGNMLSKHSAWNNASIIRLFPTLFAVLYFAVLSKKSSPKWILAIPLTAIAVFLANPIGRQVFYYPLMFWLIPLIAYRFKNNLYIKSLGATFVAHSVGGAAWIWALHLPAKVWIGLIPVVIEERLLFAAGISISFVLTREALKLLVSKHVLPKLEVSQS